MRKLIVFIAIGLLVIGGILLGVAISKGSFYSDNNKVVKNYDVEEAFNNINIDGDTSKITFYKATDGKCKVECIESEKNYHEVSVSENTLFIKEIDETKWYMQAFSFNFYKKEVKIYLPNDNYDVLTIKNDTGDIDIPSTFSFNNLVIDLSTGDVHLKANVSNDINIKSSTGYIYLDDLTCKNLSITTSTGHKELTNVNVEEDVNLLSSTGKVKINGLNCKNLKIEADTGDISLIKVIATNNLNIETSTGDVTFDASDAETIKVNTSTGDVKGNLLTEKSFYAHSSSGKVNVPKTTGNICEIETSTGKIDIEVKPAN